MDNHHESLGVNLYVLFLDLRLSFSKTQKTSFLFAFDFPIVVPFRPKSGPAINIGSPVLDLGSRKSKIDMLIR